MDKDIQQQFILLSKGSAKAFEEIYVNCYDSSVRFCVSLIKDRVEAEGIVQEVFTQLWQKREKLDEGIEFKSYLFACLKNKTFDRLRAIKKSQEAIESLWYNIGKVQNEQAEELSDLKIDSLLDAIEDLPPGRKQIIQLRYLKGKSYKEIAEQLDISSNTVKNQLIKAKQHLKSTVEYQLTWLTVVVVSLFF